MVLPGEIGVESYIMQLESTIGKLTGEIETLRNENESLKKKLLIYENPHTPPSLMPFTPRSRSLLAPRNSCTFLIGPRRLYFSMT